MLKFNYYFLVMSMPTKTITLKVPSNISKKKIEEAIKRLELEEKYKKTDNFKLFVKDEDLKIKIYKIAEFVEKYLKKKYPKEEFEIVLDYDGIDEHTVIRFRANKLSPNDIVNLLKELNSKVSKKYNLDVIISYW